MSHLEALLSARLFLSPQLAGERLYFISNLSGRLSLYAMNLGGSVPEPLIPPNIALQNPDLLEGRTFVVLPRLGRLLVMIDRDGDEVYQPFLVPFDGGYPEPVFAEAFSGHKVVIAGEDKEASLVYLLGESRTQALWTLYRADLASMTLTRLSESVYGGFPLAVNPTHTQLVLVDAYGAADNVLYTLAPDGSRRPLFGLPPEQRQPDGPPPNNGISFGAYSLDEQGLIVNTILFDNQGGLAYLPLDDPQHIRPINLTGLAHTGVGELQYAARLRPDGDRWFIRYNIDGCSWAYEGRLDEANLTLALDTVLVGQGTLSHGVLESLEYDKASDRYALVFSTATSPTQLYVLSGAQRDCLTRQTNERLLGLPANHLAAGEDYSFTTFDGLRVSARLYLPAAELGRQPPYPLVYYIHGGPQSQERPDFAWFSMPLIQLLTLHGFAVFVPNVRGSTGYGFDYMNRVVRDWGGQDVRDHVHAMTEILPRDPRLDLTRAGVTGRSYGGFMTLTLAFRFAHLWRAAVDMFGPYDLTRFAERVPETWKPFMKYLVGDPETERDFLLARSPRTYADQLACPLLVIQGKNDPRVWEIESRELVEELRAAGKSAEFLLFEDEGHDILKYANRVTCYQAIVDFFAKHLSP